MLNELVFCSAEITLMREDDIPFVLDIERQSNPHPWSESSFREAFASGYLCLVAREAQCIVGFAIVQVLVDDAELLLIAVNPSSRRSGCASMLLAEAVQRLSLIDRSPLHLEVRRSNAAAIAFYEARKFALTGVRKNYYPSGVAGQSREDALLMSLALRS
ncbi:MAG: ribosomal-protein-alanine N-acetyltransferase [Betaproteobacteria bacterium]|nr:MAG: ribosomal-protein-alanine N-acetyltransferase [Betaproteobacteria bacterium]TAG44963.1 MAG: ribosomal-protein-alanine N-acetyltransferase [Betaproteobacteria bacterium]